MILSFESLLSIYKNKTGYEELIAIGYVLNIQENGIIQIRIIKFINKEDEKLPLKTRNTLIFKTALSRQYVDIEAIKWTLKRDSVGKFSFLGIKKPAELSVWIGQRIT